MQPLQKCNHGALLITREKLINIVNKENRAYICSTVIILILRMQICRNMVSNGSQVKLEISI